MPENGGADGARAAVLARLWGAIAREPIDGIRTRERRGPTLTVTLDDGRHVHGPAAAAEPFALAGGLTLHLDRGRPAAEGYDDPGTLVRALNLPGETVRLADEVDNSVANLALARDRQPRPDGGVPTLVRARRQPDPTAYLEQCVVDGHPLHPCCRTRIGLAPDEVLAYAPEHRPVVELALVDVPPDRWFGIDCPPVLPVHPWQRDHMLERYGLRPSGRTQRARPLMSLRTLSIDPTGHVKTAVDVQMTSAVRTVSSAAVHNGPSVSRLMLELTRRTPGLTIMPELRTGAVLVDGEPCRSLAVVHRDPPRLAAGEVAMPLAVLAAASPADGRPILAEVITTAYGDDPEAFVAGLASLLFPPLLLLLELGVALEAHGQNLLVVLRDNRPVRLVYRDFGGVRISPRRLERHGIEAPVLRGDLAEDEPDALRTKLFGAVLTVLGELIAVLGRDRLRGYDGGLDPADGWRRVAEVLRPWRHGYGDSAALFDATIPVKATTAMRLARDPLDDLWAQVPNPMAGWG